MSSTSRAILSDALRQAPCVLVENVPMDVGEMFVKKLKSLGVNVTLCRANGDTRRLCIENR